MDGVNKQNNIYLKSKFWKRGIKAVTKTFQSAIYNQEVIITFHTSEETLQEIAVAAQKLEGKSIEAPDSKYKSYK